MFYIKAFGFIFLLNTNFILQESFGFLIGIYIFIHIVINFKPINYNG